MKKILALTAILSLVLLLSCESKASVKSDPSVTGKEQKTVKVPKNKKLDPSYFPLYSDLFVGGVSLDQDAKIYVWNGCQLTSMLGKDSPEGKQFMRVSINKSVEWFGWGIHVYPEGDADMTAFQNGSLRFFYKTSNDASPVKFGVKSGFATESWVAVTNGVYGFQSDNQWHEVIIPFDDFKPAVKFKAVTIYFMMSQQVAPPKGISVYYLNGIIWKK